MRSCWRDLGNSILGEHIKAHPGTRPAAWWLFSSPVSEAALAAYTRPIGERDRHFAPWNSPPNEAWYFNPDRGPETTVAYLDRIGELTDAERAALNRAKSTGRLSAATVVDTGAAVGAGVDADAVG